MLLSEHSSIGTRAGRNAARVAIVTLALCALVLPAFAAAEGEHSSARKLGRGLAGMTLGILEIPGNIVQESRTTKNAAAGLTLGLGIGLGKFVVRTLTGTYEFLTAPFETPAGFEPVLQPEYPWGYFDSAPGRVYGFSDRYLSEEEFQLDRMPGVEIERRDGALVVRFPEALLFSLNSSELSPAAARSLGELARVLRRHPDAAILVAGYTDTMGDSAYNERLSQARAATVRSSLAAQGVDVDRIAAEGFGDARPVVSNDTLAGRRSNRRVEIELRAGGVGVYR